MILSETSGAPTPAPAPVDGCGWVHPTHQTAIHTTADPLQALPSTSSSGPWKASSKRNPCPVCGRTKDGDCRQKSDQVICHHPRDLAIGEVITRAGANWAFTRNTSDGRGAHFVLDKPRDGSRPIRRVVGSNMPQKAKASATPIDQPIRLAQLPEDARPAGGSPYSYSHTQQVTRTELDSGKKRFCPQHLVGDAWVFNAGPEPWPLFNESNATGAAEAGLWILEVEGEKCVDIATAAGYVAISQPGHAHGVDQIRPRYERLAAAGLAGVVYLADADDTGRKRAQQATEAASLARLRLVVIHAGELWPELPAGGSIDDLPQGEVADAMAAIEAAAPLAAYRSTGEKPATGDESTVTKGKDKQSYEKARRLRPDEVLQLLPIRIGQPRLNLRSGDIETADGPILANDASRLYLKLSDSTTTWGKEVTIDALASHASAAAFDPVREYLEGISSPPLPMELWERLDRHLLGIDDPIATEFLPQFLISAVARVFEPGCSVRRSPVLIGPQWRGKTALGRILFGADVWVEGVRSLDTDAVLRCHTAWGVELAELDGITRRSDREQLKAFLTEMADTARRPYDRAPERMPRRFVFWGTSNGAPLRDTTGSTRFVCIPLPDQDLPLDWAKAHRDQLWARALEQYRAGVEWDRQNDESRRLTAERNANHQEIDPWADTVLAALNDHASREGTPVPLTTVFDRLAIPVERRSPRESGRIRAIAESAGWQLARKRVGEGKKASGFWPPAPIEPGQGGQGGQGVATHIPGRAPASDAKASQRVAREATHKPQDLKTKEVREQQRPPEVEPATPPQNTTRTLSPVLSLATLATTSNPSHASAFNGQGMGGRTPGHPVQTPGHPGQAEPPPPWLTAALVARDLAPPGALPAVLVNHPDLEPWHRIPLTGAMVAKALARFDAGEWPELRAQPPAGQGGEQ